MPPATSRPTPLVKYPAVEPLPSPSNMPSRTSSRAFSAAALLCASCSANGFSNRSNPRGDPLLVAEDGAPRDQHGGARFHYQRRGLGVDAAVDFDLDFGRHGPQAANLLGTVGDELLAPEARLDGHHVDRRDVGQDLSKRLDRGGRVDGNARLGAQLPDPHHRAVQRCRRLDLDLDEACACLDERFDEELWSLDHEVRLDRKISHLAHGLDDERAEGEVGHKVPVHHVDLDAVGARAHRLLHLLAKAAGVGGQDRGNDLDLDHRPAASRSRSHRAPAIMPDGTSPRFAIATACALPAPAARMLTRWAPRRACSVRVTRSGGGLGELRTPTAHPFAFRAASPGKSDAVWPSSPTPSTTTSSGASPATTRAYAAAPSSGPSSPGIRCTVAGAT